tara:strand:- start:4677 stop:4901 length:225 start_codon:yes stop_codon:yes gene_type:complete
MKVVHIEELSDAELDKLVLTKKWVNEQVNRLAGWEILVAYCRGKSNIEIDHWELCDRIGYPRVCATINKIRKML